eukprot:3934919-Rhodomonas_salina.2
MFVPDILSSNPVRVPVPTTNRTKARDNTLENLRSIPRSRAPPSEVAPLCLWMTLGRCACVQRLPPCTRRVNFDTASPPP